MTDDMNALHSRLRSHYEPQGMEVQHVDEQEGGEGPFKVWAHHPSSYRILDRRRVPGVPKSIPRKIEISSPIFGN